jgi:hypothetical protein
MNKRILAALAVLLFAGALNFLAAANDKTRTWKGYVTDTWCGLDRETKAPTVACTNLCLQNKGAKYALYDVVNNKLYVLNPQDQAAKYAAKMVIVTGNLGDNTQLVTAKGSMPGSAIIASSISVVPSKSN